MAHAHAFTLVAHDRRVDHISLQRNAGLDQGFGGRNHGRETALLILAPAPVEPAILDYRFERVSLPNPLCPPHVVHMATEQQSWGPFRLPAIVRTVACRPLPSGIGTSCISTSRPIRSM